MYESVVENLESVRERIRQAARNAGRNPEDVALLAVSKKHPADAIRVVAGGGQRLFGESYLQEALDKIEALRDLDLEWHFIGPIQSNKTAAIAGHFAWVHSVDRGKIARRLSDQRPDSLPPLQVCLQVNVSGEQSKSGVSPDELPDLVREVAGLPRLTLRGLMAIPAPCDDPQIQRQPFRMLKETLVDLAAQTGLTLDTLSMGMSGDLEAAVAEGATMVRIGTDIFGAR